MAKEITDKKERKEKKEKKEKRASLDGVTKVKKEKSDKKDKKDKKKRESGVNGNVADALEAELKREDNEDATMVDAGDETVVSVADADEARLTGALVPFAFPLADDQKELKKILKTVKKCEFQPSQPSQVHCGCVFSRVLARFCLLLTRRDHCEEAPIRTYTSISYKRKS
jgi:hypothetical protein